MERITQTQHDTEPPIPAGNKGHVFEDGFVNPPLPYIEGTDEIDLNELARQSRDGERRTVMTMDEALSQEGGYHNSHMVNPELHPTEPGKEVDLGAVQAAFRAANAPVKESLVDTDISSED